MALNGLGGFGGLVDASDISCLDLTYDTTLAGIITEMTRENEYGSSPQPALFGFI